LKIIQHLCKKDCLKLKKQIKNIAISRTDNLGDVILTLPLAGYLKTQNPTYNIFFIGKNYTQPIIESSIFIDHFLDREAILQNPQILQEAQIDAIIFVFPDKDLAQLAKKINIPFRIGTSHRWFHWLYCNQKVSFSRKKSTLHESQLNFKLLEGLGINHIPTLNEIPDLYGMKAAKETVQPMDADKLQIIFHPKSKGSAREWGLDNYYQLAQQLPNNQFQVYITGTQAEGDLIRQEKPEIFEFSHVKDMTGKLSLHQLIDFIAQADILLACSTGPLHIASALGKYAIGIYPPIRPMHPERWQPLGKHAVCLVLDKNCEACRKTPEKCACIQAIEVAQVKSKILEIYQNKNQSI
jgi:heptosyltransferase III